MFLEAFFSAVASNVFVEIFKRAIDKKWKRLDEPAVRRIIENSLQQYHLSGQTSVIQNEIVMILGNSGVLGPGGQFLLPPSHKFPDLPELIGAWWDGKVYKIVSVMSEKVLDVEGKSMHDGVSVQQWDYYGTPNQQWRLIPVGGNSDLFKIHSQQSAKVLDVPSMTRGKMGRGYSNGHMGRSRTNNGGCCQSTVAVRCSKFSLYRVAKHSMCEI